MALTKPTGFSNFRTYRILLKTDSGQEPYFVLGSFYRQDVSGKTIICRGANIVSSTAAAETVFTTDEPHGLSPGQTIHVKGHRISADGQASVLRNGEITVLATPTSTTFSADLDTVAEGAGAGGIAGVDTEDYYLTVDVAAINADPHTRQDRADNDAEEIWKADEFFG